MADSSRHYPLTIESVKKIKKQNREGIKPAELEVTEVQVGKPKEVEPEYADLVGQISLKSLEKTTRKRRDKENSRSQNNPQGGDNPKGQNPQGRGSRNKGQQPSGKPRQPNVQANAGNNPTNDNQQQNKGPRPKQQGTGNNPNRNNRNRGNRGGENKAPENKA